MSSIPPHPDPLPRGEGEPSAALRQIEALAHVQRRTTEPPLPRGEGWGEGKGGNQLEQELRHVQRHSNIARQGKSYIPLEGQTRAFVYLTHPGDVYRAGRTLRSLRAAGIAAEQISEPTGQRLGDILRAGGPVLLLRAGAWLVQAGALALPLPSATGKGLCALGALRVPRESEPESQPGIASKREWRSLSSGLDGSASSRPEVGGTVHGRTSFRARRWNSRHPRMNKQGTASRSVSGRKV